ncbi:MAG TPA: C1 family peptidase [Longimicrobium sp.]|jgi:C1A family cysteine protease
MASTTQQVQTALAEANAQWTAGDTPVSSRSDQERRRALGAVPSAAAMARAKAAPQVVAAAFDTVVDWRSRNGGNQVTPVRDQGGCGSCVSFATCALIESMARIERGTTLDLSEADSHFCSVHGPTCDGWWPDACLDEAISRGICPESQFPYATAFPNGDIFAQPPKCVVPAGRSAVQVAARVELASPVSVKNRLTSTGPVVGCFTVYEDFYHYKTGIYHHVTGTEQGGHCVLVIGYSEPDQCWICKNSWHTTWGDAGFFRIAYADFLLSNQFFPMYGASGVIP